MTSWFVMGTVFYAIGVRNIPGLAALLLVGHLIAGSLWA
jgi:hypothetical protein